MSPAAAWLVLRSRGCLWGVTGRRVEGVERSGDGYVVRLAGCRLFADEVAQLDMLGEVRKVGPIVAGAAPAGCTGLGLSELGPVVVIDVDSPPALLLSAEVREETRNGS